MLAPLLPPCYVATGGRKGGAEKEIRRLIVSAGSKNAGGVAAFSSVFSQESSATATSSLFPFPSSSPPPFGPTLADHPLTLILPHHSFCVSPGIYNTLCFPSAICLGFSAPSLTLLSRVLFLFNSAVFVPRPLRDAVVTYPSRNLTSAQIPVGFRATRSFCKTFKLSILVFFFFCERSGTCIRIIGDHWSFTSTLHDTVYRHDPYFRFSFYVSLSVQLTCLITTCITCIRCVIYML